jgi:hypothetical protein
MHTGQFSSHSVQLVVNVIDCLGRSLTKTSEFRCVSEELTFSDASDIDKVFFFYKNKNRFQEPLKPNIDKQISLQPAFFNYKMISSECKRDDTPTNLDDSTVSSLILLSSHPNIFTSSPSGTTLKIIKDPNFSLSTSTIVTLRYQITRLNTEYLSDSLSLNLQMLDFTLLAPYFQNLPTNITVLTSTSFLLNPCKNRLFILSD